MNTYSPVVSAFWEGIEPFAGVALLEEVLTRGRVRAL